MTNHVHNITPEVYGAITYTTTDFTDTRLQLSQTVAGVIAQGIPQCPYTNTSYERTMHDQTVNQNGIRKRIVGCGIRVRYIGTELNKGGRMILARHPDGGQLGALTASELLAFQTVATTNVTREWQSVSFKPTQTADYEFSPRPYRNDFDGGIPVNTKQLWEDNMNTSMAIFVTGAAPLNSFEWEIVHHVEFTGVTDNVTKSHTDIGGMSIVRNNLDYNDKPGDPKAKEASLLSKTLNQLYNSQHVRRISRNVLNQGIQYGTGGLRLEHFGL